jgi:hypothetical protein
MKLYHDDISSSENNVNFFDEENDDDDDGEQPEWVDLVQPCADFHFESEFKYDDGGADL